MKVGNKYYESVWFDDSRPGIVSIIDQEKLPFIFGVCELESVADVCEAIKRMKVRGAPAIGVAAAFGMYLATLYIKDKLSFEKQIRKAAEDLITCRPTAVNLSWAVNRMAELITGDEWSKETPGRALEAAKQIRDIETSCCRQIGINGLKPIKDISEKKKGGTVNILTHCNAGWLACVDYGTALAPVYEAHSQNIPVHVWVDETRPRNQGASLTAWELQNSAVPYSLIADNTGGLLMQKGMVDLVITGSDRTTRNGDVANKIGTYLKALAAYDNNIPFYVALPTSTIDLSINNGITGIDIEERDPDEVRMVTGFDGEKITSVRICPDNTKSVNFGFDITPSRLVTGLITEKGICRATEEDIVRLFSVN
jgi:methylthioribose-1-phosphate isomerase